MYSPFNCLPDYWQEWVKQYSLKKSNGKFDRLSAYDFPSNVTITFPDGSNAHFIGAFFIENTDRRELAVFTEHCGYHIFPLTDLEYSYDQST